MGSKLSAFIIEPIIGIAGIALAIMAIMQEQKDNQTNARWLAIGSVATIISLIVLNIVLTIMIAG